MIPQFGKLDGILCLGETLKVRKMGEETAQTNAQAAIIAINALKSITNAGSRIQKSKQEAATRG